MQFIVLIVPTIHLVNVATHYAQGQILSVLLMATVGQQVIVEFGEGHCCNAKVVDRKQNDFGNVYQVDWSEFFKEAKNYPWMMEQFLTSSNFVV